MQESYRVNPGNSAIYIPKTPLILRTFKPWCAYAATVFIVNRSAWARDKIDKSSLDRLVWKVDHLKTGCFGVEFIILYMIERLWFTAIELKIEAQILFAAALQRKRKIGN